MTPEEQLEKVFHSPDPARALLSLIRGWSQDGRAKPEIYALLEQSLLEMRGRPNYREADEEILLDAMDALTGWCHPLADPLKGAGPPQPPPSATSSSANGLPRQPGQPREAR